MASSAAKRGWSALAALAVVAGAAAAWRFTSIPALVLQAPKTENQPAPSPLQRWEDVDRDIAARFSPVFHQGMIGAERFDYITNFDFDGDWHGDNNWEHAADRRFPMKAYVYYAVSETPTHYFVHYAAFHPRDWKGGERAGRVLSGTIREGTTVGGAIKARGIMADLVLSHENDLEGCLVVAEKHGAALDAARVILVETMAHNQYLRFAAQPDSANVKPLRLDEQHPLLYVEAQGHGIEAFHDQPVRKLEPGEEVVASAPESDADAEVDSNGDAGSDAGSRAASASGAASSSNGSTGTQASSEPSSDPKSGAVSGDEPRAPKQGRLSRVKRITKVKSLVTNRFRIEGVPTSLLLYKFSGTADDPEAIKSGSVGYDLVPLYSTFWTVAARGENDTFAEATDYGTRTITVLGPGAGNLPTISTRQITIGRIGSALRGVAGAENKARAPWGWFDRGERSRPPGEWFFDPAATVQRHLGSLAASWATAYLHQPFLGVIRSLMATGPTDPGATLVPAGAKR